MSDEDRENGYGLIYILTNPGMPGLIKIGFTTRDNVDARRKELSRPEGVPFEFVVAKTARVKDPKKVEKAFHLAFARKRANPKKEFFTLDVEEVLPLIEVMNVPVVEVSVPVTSDPVEDIAAAEFEADRDERGEEEPDNQNGNSTELQRVAAAYKNAGFGLTDREVSERSGVQKKNIPRSRIKLWSMGLVETTDFEKYNISVTGSQKAPADIKFRGNWNAEFAKHQLAKVRHRRGPNQQVLFE